MENVPPGVKQAPGNLDLFMVHKKGLWEKTCGEC